MITRTGVIEGSTDAMLSDILDREGWPVYTDHPLDRGGPTKGGITLRTLESWRGKGCGVQALSALTRAEALAILRRRYVETNGIDKLPPGPLQAQIVDDAVLSGPMLAVMDLQRAVGTTVDGIIGPHTLSSLIRTGSARAAILSAVERTLRLCRHVAANPDQSVFLVGWVTRCLSFATVKK